MNRAELFLQDIRVVCLKHNLSISHEDCHGSFKVEEFDGDTMDWLMAAGEYWHEK